MEFLSQPLPLWLKLTTIAAVGAAFVLAWLWVRARTHHYSDDA